MIKLEKVEVYGWEAAIRGMRNPMNSWDKSDSTLCKGADGFEDCTINACGECPRYEDFRQDIFCVGSNDLKLMKNLSKAGSDHGKFLRMINVTVDITAPLYWWKEFDTYKVGTVANSCSTMHKIHDKEFTLDDFSHDYINDDLNDKDVWFRIYCCNSNSDDYLEDEFNDGSVLNLIIHAMNYYRNLYMRTKNKRYWYKMIQLLPSSYNQKRTIQLNYQVLKSMFHARKNHKLDEWLHFCDWCYTLPYFKEICGDVIE